MRRAITYYLDYSKMSPRYQIYILNPSPLMHAIWLCTSSLHFSSASGLSYFMKQSSRADLVAGQAQQLWGEIMDTELTERKRRTV